MYISKWWGNYVGGSDDALLLLDYFKFKGKKEIELAEIYRDLNLLRFMGSASLYKGGDIRFFTDDIHHSDFIFAIDAVTDLSALLLESIKTGCVRLKEFGYKSDVETAIKYDKASIALLLEELELFIREPCKYDIHQLVDEQEMYEMAAVCKEIHDELRLYVQSVEPLKELLSKLPSFYPARLEYEAETSEVWFIQPESLEKFQAGYRFHGITGEDLTGVHEGDWQPSWFAIGNIPALGGDPLFTDISDESLPLFTAMHGAGRWDEIQTAESLYNLPEILIIEED